jgi:hypothetical protein
MPRILTDHETIRRWAEGCGVQPRCPEAMPGEEGPGLQLSPAEADISPAAQPVTWAAWFRLFDAHDLALVIDDASRQPSPFNQIVKRPAAADDRVTPPSR